MSPEIKYVGQNDITKKTKKAKIYKFVGDGIEKYLLLKMPKLNCCRLIRAVMSGRGRVANWESGCNKSGVGGYKSGVRWLLIKFQVTTNQIWVYNRELTIQWCEKPMSLLKGLPC